MLTVRVRFRNTGAAPAKISLAGGGVRYHTANYIVAGDTRYDIMRDPHGNVLATPRDGGGWLEPTIRPKGSFAWWANYAAPPATQKSYTLYLKVAPPSTVFGSSTSDVVWVVAMDPASAVCAANDPAETLGGHSATSCPDAHGLLHDPSSKSKGG